MTAYRQLQQQLAARPRLWLVTGVAGFIGSHLLETLLRLDQRVIGLDNYSTGSRRNLDQVRELAGPEQWRNFRPIEGDIRDPGVCHRACQGVDFVLHQAALDSVPQSMSAPADAHGSNVTGFLNVLMGARDCGVRRVVFASCSSVYGDDVRQRKIEHRLGRCLSPFALTKRANELYAEVFARCYGMETVGLRYFNVFGPRQHRPGHPAAVIPNWIGALMRDEPVLIHGDGRTSRGFCHVANIVQANLLAATVENPAAVNEVYNVGVSTRTSLNQLFTLLREALRPHFSHLKRCRPVYQDFRPGEILHLEADISKAARLLGYQPTHDLAQGLVETLAWYRPQELPDRITPPVRHRLPRAPVLAAP